MQFKKKLWIGILVLTLLTPIGIILPEKFDAGDAWGEWSAETVGELLGFVPEKLRENSEIWNAPVPDYNLGNEESPFYVQMFSYIFSAIVGIAIIAILMFGYKRFIIRNE